MSDSPINLNNKLATFNEHWSPKSVASFNGHDVMVVKDRDITLGPGELYVIPKGVEHCTSAKEEAHLLLIEPAGTPNTGDVNTAAVVEKI